MMMTMLLMMMMRMRMRMMNDDGACGYSRRFEDSAVTTGRKRFAAALRRQRFDKERTCQRVGV
jgi:hypothetical protein